MSCQHVFCFTLRNRSFSDDRLRQSLSLEDPHVIVLRLPET